MKSAAANKSPPNKRAHIYNDDGEEREKAAVWRARYENNAQRHLVDKEQDKHNFLVK